MSIGAPPIAVSDREIAHMFQGDIKAGTPLLLVMTSDPNSAATCRASVPKRMFRSSKVASSAQRKDRRDEQAACHLSHAVVR